MGAFANLRLRLAAPAGRAEAYAKVTSVTAAGTFVLRFTSLDPEAARAIDAAMVR